MDIIPTVPRAPRSRPTLSAPMGDSSLFVSPEVASFYHDVIVNRKFVPERSYQIDAFPSEAWCGNTQTLNGILSKFNASILKEFYVNLPANLKGSKYCVCVQNVSSSICYKLGLRF